MEQAQPAKPAAAPMEWINVSVVMRPGVYALVRRGRVIFVGQSRAVYQRIYGHRQVTRYARGVTPAWSPLRGFQFDEVWVRPCRLEELDEVEAEARTAWEPYWNKDYGPQAPAEGAVEERV